MICKSRSVFLLFSQLYLFIPFLSMSHTVTAKLPKLTEYSQQNFSLPSICGRLPTHRIIGGRSVSPELWPWLVTLRTSWGSAFCGGTLITNQHVLSAAHCLDPFRRKQYKQLLKIAPGVYERQTEKNILLDIESFVLHPQFGDVQMFHSDIGIITLVDKLDSFMTVCLPNANNNADLKLNIYNDIPDNKSKLLDYNPVNTTYSNTSLISNNSNTSLISDNSNSTANRSAGIIEFVSMTTLSNNDHNFGADNVDYELLEEQYNLNKNISYFEDDFEKEGVILGWGRLKEYDRLSETLQQAEIILLNHTLCGKAYGNVFDSESMVCAGRLEGGVDSCQGDSGGPLLTKDVTGTWTQIGIVSFGFGCGSPDFPGVYTNVSNYMSWIEATIRDN